MRLGERVAALTADGLVLDDGRAIAADLVPWVTGAAAHPWLARGLPELPPLPCDDRGFVQIDDDLQVMGCPGLFAAGDCAVLRSWPQIPKAGVFAVREGPVLWANLQAAAAGGRLENYQPQRDFLTLLNLGDGRALGLRNGFALSGAWVMALKDRIDRRFMARFQVLDSEGGTDTDYGRQMPVMDESAMVCGGCAAKVGQDPLAGALQRLGARPDPDLVLGLERPDDVAALRRGGELLVTSIDAFPAFLDDPWLVGQVAAHNALSDLLAKGVAPRLALALVSVPEDADPEELLFQVLSGIRGVLDAAGVSLAGGHSTVGPRLEVGLSITGFCPDDGRLMTKAGLQPGDRLVLTRPLGTGVLLHADMAGRAAGPWIAQVIAGMTQGNGRAAAIARDQGVLAATDVTGFGLAGHAAELSRASGLPLHLNLGALPALPGALTLLRQGERSTFHEQNRRGLRGIELARPPASPEEAALLELAFDPQTAGGLLLGVPAGQVDALIRALRQAGIGDATPIGYAGADRSARSPLHLEWEF